MHFSGLSPDQKSELLPSGTILVGYRGSIAHGMHTGGRDGIDDRDIMGVCINPLKDYFGLGQTLGKRGVYERFIGEWDAVSYELRKYVSLLAKANPNVLSLLWLKPEHYIHISPPGQVLIDNRDMFASKLFYKSFTGYAHGQLHRMTHISEEAYKTGYMGAKRKALTEKWGFDRKNAAHCIRLLRMGIEFLNEGTLYVHRHDARELLDIKTGESGKWTLEVIQAEADRLMRRADDAYDRCTLPEKPDSDRINTLLVEMLEEHFYGACNAGYR